MQENLKLNTDQATTAFDILDILQERFPDNPEMAGDILKVLLTGLESPVGEGQ